MDTTQRAACISVTAPISPAFERMRRILFGPFDLEKWLVMGFCAFLAGLARMGVPDLDVLFRKPQPPPFAPAQGMPPEFAQQMANFTSLMARAMPAATVALLILWPLLKWLGSRGDFMLLDGVVHDRAAVTAPWKAFKRPGNSLFVMRLLIGIAFLGIAVVMAGFSLAFVWRHGAGARAGGLGAAAAPAFAVVLGVMAFVVIAAYLLIESVLSDFIVPVMYRRGVSAKAAIGVLWNELLPGRDGKFILFYLMKIGLWILIVLAVAVPMVLTCCFCCLGLIPYISTVLFLPLFVFFRCYSLYFLEQFGPEWQFFEVELQAAPPPAAAGP